MVGSLSGSQPSPKKQFKTSTMPAMKAFGGMPYGRSFRSQNEHQEQGKTPTSAHSHSRTKSSDSRSGTLTLSSLSTLCSGKGIGGSRSSSGTAMPQQLPT
ncbi:hypothetical protein BDQ12DRAFT_307826 [Crucibulum laeve]|uniref:Uncharacterized protein n=1 Tax=Crucibulum laeve TaxID=68775 RepID=A0A5C3LRR1_9AGAR|nr:hypothetical protein BDQ12DRAFT_307826 [Crucibulum laeve]